jgi:uncharacterized protein YbjT (DUF2867 family)
MFFSGVIFFDMNGKTALIIGATGLVGKSLTKALIMDESFSSVKVFVRRSTGIVDPKLQEYITDFKKPESIKEYLKGDVFFSCLGTTIKQAGSKDNQYKIDYTYQYNLAKIAAENKVPSYALVSASMANSKSKIFYSRMKGELDEAISKLPFKDIRIFRPGILAGERENPRKMEKLSAKFIDSLAKVIPPLKKYRSIKGSDVAQAMINDFLKESSDSHKIYELNEVHNLLHLPLN